MIFMLQDLLNSIQVGAPYMTSPWCAKMVFSRSMKLLPWIPEVPIKAENGTSGSARHPIRSQYPDIL